MQTCPISPGFGLWKADRKRLPQAMTLALELGYRHFDCAPVYGNEAEAGEVLAAWLSRGGRRDELWLTSKLWNDSHRPEDVRPALERTLSDLRQDHLDAWLIHWPIHNRPGARTARTAADLLPPEAIPTADTWQAMTDCLRAGLTRHIGVSNFSLPKLKRLWDTADIKPTVVQAELHPYLPQPELVDFCRRRGILLVAASPLGSGDRPRALKQTDEPCLLDDPVLAKVARKHGASPAQVLIAWALARGTAVVPKAVSPRHLRENFAAQDLKPDAEDLAALAGLACGRRYISGDHGMAASPYTQAWLWEQ